MCRVTHCKPCVKMHGKGKCMCLHACQFVEEGTSRKEWRRKKEMERKKESEKEKKKEKEGEKEICVPTIETR